MRRSAILVTAAALGVALFYSQGVSAAGAGDDQIPLQQWSSPLYWQPSVPERASVNRQRFDEVAAAAATAEAPMPYVSITPCRLIDTRGVSGLGAAWGLPALVANTDSGPISADRLFTATGTPQCPEIPAGARAVAANVVATRFAANGRVTVYPGDASSRPVVSTVAFRLPVAYTPPLVQNYSIIPLDSSGAFRAFASQDTDLIVDVNGYYAPETGDVLVSAGFGSWNPFNSSDPLSYTYFSSQTQVSRSAAGSSFLSVNPDLATVVNGRSLSLKAVQFCYDTFASTSLNYIEINTYSHTTGSLGRNLRLSDPTTRTGNECRLYTLPAPVLLNGNSGVNFFAQVSWAVANAQFAIGRTTFVLAPTGNIAPPLATPPQGASDPVVTLTPAIDTAAP